LVAGLTLRQRVDELGDMAAGLPHLAGQDDARVKADNVVAPGDRRLPPLPLDVVLDLDAKRPVVPGRPQAAVDLAGRVDDSPPLAETDDGFQAVAATSHECCPAPGAVDELTGALDPAEGRRCLQA